MYASAFEINCASPISKGIKMPLGDRQDLHQSYKKDLKRSELSKLLNISLYRILKGLSYLIFSPDNGLSTKSFQIKSIPMPP